MKNRSICFLFLFVFISYSTAQKLTIFTEVNKNLVKLDEKTQRQLQKIVNRNENKNKYSIITLNNLNEAVIAKHLLFENNGKVVTLMLKQQRHDAEGKDVYTFVKDQGNYAVLVVRKTLKYACIEAEGEIYIVEPISDQYYVQTEIEKEKLSRGCSTNDANSSVAKSTLSFDKNRNMQQINSQKTVYQFDVLVFYTNEAMVGAGGQSSIEDLISAIEGQTNTVYSNCNVNYNMSVVDKLLLPNFTEYSLTDLNLSAFGQRTDVASLREQYGADICVLVTEAGNNGGQAATIPAEFNSAYCVVKRAESFTDKSFVHEIGHLQGCNHQITSEQLHIYANGYYYGPQDMSQRFRTIMAFQDSRYGDTPTRILQFSDPDATYNGHLCGTSIANNVAMLNNASQASTIQNFLTPSIIANGLITSSSTWSGKVVVNGNLTVASGATLTINSGTEVYFVNGASLIVNGCLYASNTSFASVYTWGGIQFNSGSSGLLNSCTINNVLTYGGAAISINNASPTIQNCTINNNSGVTSGVSLFNSSGATLTNNNISSSSSYALYFYNSNGYLSGNTLTGGSTYTAYCYDHSSPWFTPYGTGNNIIQEGTHGVYAYYYSAPSLSSGNNSIWNNSTYQAAAYSNSVIYANSVCWGTQNPALNNDGTSTINWLNPIQCSSPKFMEGGNKTSRMPTVYSNDDNIAKAHDLRLNARYSEAVNICKNIINIRGNLTEANAALVELGFIYKENKDKSILDFIQSIELDKRELIELKPAALSTLSNIYYSNHDYSTALETTERLIKHYQGTEHEKAANLNLVFLYASMGENDLATTALDNFRKKYTDDKNILAAEWFLKSHPLTPADKEQNVSDPNKILQSEENFETDELVSNYPNPFNPSTQISFTLKESGKVSLKIYDVLGKEVANLADGYYEAGKHTATFNGSNLASGIYFYRLTTPTATITKKMMLLK